MRKLLLTAALIVVAALSSGVAGAGPVPQASQTTQYWYGSTSSNTWRLSPSWARRTHHYVEARGGGCLPSNAQFQVANFTSGGATLIQLNTRRSPYGACAFLVNLTSNEQYARAGCRIVSSVLVTRTILCNSTWY